MKIPKVFHHIWLGEETMHPLMVEWRTGWKELHPNFTMILWRGATYDTSLDSEDGRFHFDSQFPDLLARACHLSQRSNIFRYELLNRFGGIYLDTDMEPAKNIEALVEDEICFAGEAEHMQWGAVQRQVGNAIIGTVPYSPLTQDLVSRLHEADPAISTSLGVLYFMGSAVKQSSLKLFPPNMFYHRPSYKMEQVICDHFDFNKYDLRGSYHPDAYAYHRWSSYWFSNSFKRVTRKNPGPWAVPK